MRAVAPRVGVIWLHGLGDSGRGWSFLEEMLGPRLQQSSGVELVWRFPTAPVQPVSCNGGAQQTSWMDLPRLPLYPDTPDDVRGLRRSVGFVHHEMATMAEQQGVERIMIGGFSQGGALALAAALSCPPPIGDLLGGALVTSGWAPMHQHYKATASPEAAATATKDDAPMDALSLALSVTRQTCPPDGATAADEDAFDAALLPPLNHLGVPFFWGHGAADPVVDVSNQEQGVAALRELGASVEARTYPGLVHSVNEEELADIFNFLAAQLEAVAKE